MAISIKRATALAMALFLVALPKAAMAKERRGAGLVVATKDGSSVGGELIAVRQNSLLLLTAAGKDESVRIDDISSITIVKESKAVTGFLVGFLVGSVAGGAASASKNTHYGEALAFWVLLSGAIAGGIGLAIGEIAGTDRTIRLESLDEPGKKKALDRLRGMARMPGAQ